MTNIAAIKTQPKDPEKKQEIVVVADSMASSPHTKDDQYQKLYQVGPFLITATGNGSILYHTGNQLFGFANSGTSYSTTNQVIDAILDLNTGYNETKARREMTLFGVAGPGVNGNLELHQVFTGNQSCIPVDLRKTRRTGDQPHLWLGSGSFHVDQRVHWLHDAGISPVVTTLEDATIHAFEIAKAAARDIGVNDKLQFGLMSNGTVSTIYDPELSLTQEGLFQQYLSTMMGLPVPPSGLIEGTPDERIANYAMRDYMGDLINQVFHAFTVDLSDVRTSRRNLHYLVEVMQHGEGSPEEFTHCQEELARGRAYVRTGVNALLSHDAHQLSDYVVAFEARNKEKRDAVLALTHPD